MGKALSELVEAFLRAGAFAVLGGVVVGVFVVAAGIFSLLFCGCVLLLLLLSGRCYCFGLFYSWFGGLLLFGGVVGLVFWFCFEG